jgi:hypothetical protein
MKMLVLKFEFLENASKWMNSELLFTDNETRTAVEVGRTMKDNPKIRNVRLFDNRFGRTKTEVLVTEPYTAKVVKKVKLWTPNCTLLSLSKLPPAKKKMVEVTSNSFEMPKKTPRITKRQRQFGLETV